MKIDLIISAEDIKKDKVYKKTAVVIDMLRATSVITTAIANGCEKVIPVLTIEEALKIRKEYDKKAILGGERKGLKIEGFDFSNSPIEYSKEVIGGKTLIMTTTNGTRAIRGSEGAKDIIIGSVLNAEAVANRIIELNNDVAIVNAGTYGEFSIDDFICSGYIISCVKNKMKVELTDAAKTAYYVYKKNEDIESFVKYAKHYERIMELGLEEDFKYCCRKSTLKVVPQFINGEIL
ncbi:2-phosphosulfolactate phosphatase family protein [Clostridium felsineum]|uniref:2-phosphosulfolactate phosphatase family protein n=1 Tax=Clostridium felsineum TaxID=36839 RepID=UPI00214D6A80|nr:2-phosphosulfolactate phosphatase family protein [Clostridium felsineum]MCR3760816.1 2-phosphosulfolactate phosphatase family protein [Clostridium felsineum]